MGYEQLFENFENVEPSECELVGSVPSWLIGTMLRNGPGMFKLGGTEYKHWFDGLAYIQRYHFSNGKMHYSARYLESEAYKASMAAQRLVGTAFGTRSFIDPCKKVYGELASTFSTDEELRDNCVVAFTTVGDAVYALTETPYLARIDIDSLDYKDRVDIRDHLKIVLHTYTAHNHTDFEGNILNIGSQFGSKSNYVFAKTRNPLKMEGAKSPHSLEFTELLGMVPATDALAPAYYHSFGVTENYFILFESPERIDIMKKAQKEEGEPQKCINECMYWDEKAKSVNVIIFDRIKRTKIEQKITSDAFFTFHHANAYEKDGYLVVDYCKILNPGNFDDFLLEHMRDGTYKTRNPNLAPYLHRMIIPLTVSDNRKPDDDLLSSCSFANGCKAVLRMDDSIHCTDVRMSEYLAVNLAFDFPRYNYDLNMKDYRYVYGANVFSGNSTEGVIKVDLKNNTSKVWSMDNNSQICAEPILVNKPNYEKEDDGVLLVPVMTTMEKDTPFVSIIDAETLEELGRFLIPQSRIPFGFHSHYTPR